MAAPSIQRTIEAIWRIESPRVIGGLTRLLGDLDVAEELAQDAFLAALEQWPMSGIPDKPGAWLMATAKHRGIDLLRRRERLRGKAHHIALEVEGQGLQSMEAMEAALDDQMGDDVLRLVFIACHPVLSEEARVALTLRVLGGLTTAEIARAFLVSEPTVAQRIVRAKKTLTEQRVPFEVPAGPELTGRLTSVLAVVYLIFNEGYLATAGEDWMKPALCEDALRLGRVVAELIPQESETHGLVSLMELQASRLKARTSNSGAPVLLLDQDRSKWDWLLIQRGLAALQRAEALGPAGPYTLQAAIAACHARATVAAETDWKRIVSLYESLSLVQPSPVVELNRAVAVSMAKGPAEALQLVDALCKEPALRSYHWLPSVRGDLLAKLGRMEEAKTEFERAAILTHNVQEKRLLLERAVACRGEA